MKIDDYGDENDQKQTNTMPFKSKYTPFRHNYLVKKGPNQPGRGICDFVCLYIFTQFRSCGGGGHCALLRAQEEAVFCFPKLHNYELATIQT